jgi:hypothetical protein
LRGLRTENTEQRTNLDIKGKERQESGQNCILRSFIICALHHVVTSRRMKRIRHTTHKSEVRNAYRILVERYKGKLQL